MQHSTNRSQVDHRFAGVGQELVVLAQPSVSAIPGEGAFHHPPSGKRSEAHRVRFAHQLQEPPTLTLTFIGEPLPKLPCLIATISPHQLDTRPQVLATLEHQLGSIVVLYVGGMYPHLEQQPLSIYQHVTLSALYTLACIVSSMTRRPPFSLVLTLCVSIDAALGSSFLPSCWRTSLRSTSLMRSNTPASRHLL